MRWLFPLLVVIICFLDSCSSKNEEDEFPELNNSDSEFFTKTIAPIFKSNCTVSGCHDASTSSAGIDLTSEIDAKQANLTQLLKAINHQSGASPMPKNRSKLDQASIDNIEKWVESLSSGNGSGNGTGNGQGADNMDSLSYVSDIAEIFGANCAVSGCHDAGTKRSGYDLSSYVGVKAANSTRLLGSINHSDGFSKMPKNNDKLSDCDIAKISSWFENGTVPNDLELCKDPVVVPEEKGKDSATYVSDIAKIFETNCAFSGCHNTGTKRAGIDLSSYQAVKSVSSEKLSGVINHSVGFSPMPKNASKLSDCDIAKIMSWLDSTVVDGLEACKDPVVVEPCITDSMSYDGGISVIFNANCATSGCHDPGTKRAGFDFSTYDGIKVANSTTIIKAINHDVDVSAMPGGGNPKLDSCTIEKIEKWFADDAPKNFDPVVVTPSTTYTDDIRPIFINNCSSCHTSSSSGGVNLNNFQNATSVSTSRLLGAIKHEAGFSSMPRNAAKLGSATIDKIEEWINLGRPE